MLLGVGAMVAASRSGSASAGNAGMAALIGAAGDRSGLAACLSARAGGAGRPRRREVPHRHRPVGQGHVRDLQAPRRPDPVRGARRRSLHAVASDAGGARRARSKAWPRQSPYWDKKDPPALQPRHDLTRAKLSGFLDPPRRRRAPLSDQRQQPAGALCARHRDLPLRRSARRARADRRADPGAAEQSLFPRAQGPGAARSRQAPPRRSRRCAARCSSRRTRR